MSQFVSFSSSKRAQTSTTALGGIYLGEKPTTKESNNSIRRHSKLLNSILLPANNKTNKAVDLHSASIPPPKPPRTDLQVLRDLAKTKEQYGKNNLNPQKQSVCSIVRSVSNYKTSESYNILKEKPFIQKSRTEIFHISPGIC